MAKEDHNKFQINASTGVITTLVSFDRWVEVVELEKDGKIGESLKMVQRCEKEWRRVEGRREMSKKVKKM